MALSAPFLICLLASLTIMATRVTSSPKSRFDAVGQQTRKRTEQVPVRSIRNLDYAPIVPAMILPFEEELQAAGDLSFNDYSTFEGRDARAWKKNRKAPKPPKTKKQGPNAVVRFISNVLSVSRCMALTATPYFRACVTDSRLELERLSGGIPATVTPKINNTIATVKPTQATTKLPVTLEEMETATSLFVLENPSIGEGVSQHTQKLVGMYGVRPIEIYRPKDEVKQYLLVPDEHGLDQMDVEPATQEHPSVALGFPVFTTLCEPNSLTAKGPFGTITLPNHDHVQDEQVTSSECTANVTVTLGEYVHVTCDTIFLLNKTASHVKFYEADGETVVEEQPIVNRRYTAEGTSVSTV